MDGLDDEKIYSRTLDNSFYRLPGEYIAVCTGTDTSAAENIFSKIWRPTSSIVRVENRKHPSAKHLPEKFLSAPTEWYKWKNALRANSDIKVLISIN